MKEYLIREIDGLDPQLDRGTLFGPKAVAAIVEESSNMRDHFRPFLRAYGPSRQGNVLDAGKESSPAA